MCPPGPHHNGFVATHALGYMSLHTSLLGYMHLGTWVSIYNYIEIHKEI